MHKVPGIASINRKHTPPLLFTFYKICSFCDSSLPSRSHEVLPYCLALFLFCDPADMDVKIFFSVARRLQLSVYKVQFSFHVARETREIVVRVRNDPRSKPTFKKFNIEEFSVIDVDGTTQRLV